MGSISIERRGAVAELVLDRPAKRNALADPDWILLRESALTLAHDPTVRAVMVRGSGATFCAGWDISEAEAELIDARHVVADVVNPALAAMRAIPVPVVAAVEGACMGGGLGIAMACDVVLAASDARLGSPFGRIGIMLDSGGHHFLRRTLGHYRASHLIYTGRTLDGTEACRLGLVSEVFAPDDLLREARRMADHIAAGPTAAFRQSKRILLSDAGYDETLAAEADGQAEIFRTRDASEGLRAFREKRRPHFEGR